MPSQKVSTFCFVLIFKLVLLVIFKMNIIPANDVREYDFVFLQFGLDLLLNRKV